MQAMLSSLSLLTGTCIKYVFQDQTQQHPFIAIFRVIEGKSESQTDPDALVLQRIPSVPIALRRSGAGTPPGLEIQSMMVSQPILCVSYLWLPEVPHKAVAEVSE